MTTPAPPPLSPLVDTHCHLAWPSLADDVPGVVARARAVGVTRMVCVATDVASARASAALAGAYEGVYATAGLHPNDLPDPYEPAFETIAALVRGGGFVAVGETGLDYYRDAVPPARQRASFLAHGRLAREADLPVIVHIRDREGRNDAYDDVASVLSDLQGVRAVIHCYTGDAAHARAYVDLGCYVSFSGILTFPKGENVREAARAVPLERCLVETDAPFLAPLPHRGKRCEPAHVADTARRLAEVKGVSEDEVRRATTRNALALFGGLLGADEPTRPAGR